MAATDWTPEMQAQLDQFKQELAAQLKRDVGEVIKSELRGSEERLSRHIDVRLQAGEKRLLGQYRVSVEEVRGQVRLLGEAFGGTLDSIKSRIQTLEENVATTLKDHAKILSIQSRQIDELNRRSGH